jgi:hypothetical protein
MKTIAAAVSALAVVNLMALLFAVGWLWQTDRLSRERIEEVREIFAVTNAEAEEQAEQAAAEAEKQAEQAAAERRANQPPLTADAQLDTLNYVNQQAEMSIQRTRQEVEILQKALENEKVALAREREQFEAAKRAFEQEMEEIRQARESEQFQRTLAIYQGLDAAAVKDIWMTLINEGEVEQVVTYLGEMQARQATGVIEAIEKEDPTLAADLLERLRTHGFPVASSEEGQ